jgi:hypothetical protein
MRKGRKHVQDIRRSTATGQRPVLSSTEKFDGNVYAATAKAGTVCISTGVWNKGLGIGIKNSLRGIGEAHGA